MFGLLFRASSKMVATFVVLIAFYLLCFAYFPSVIVALQDFAEYLDGQTRNPPLDEQGTFLWRTLVNENTMLGIVTTIIARMFVELGAFTIGSLLGMRGDNRDMF